MQGLLAGHDAVTGVTVNTVVGSVLVHYDRSRLSDAYILALLDDAGFFHPDRAMTHDEYVRGLATRVGHAVVSGLVDGGWEAVPLALLAHLLFPAANPPSS